MAKIIVMMIMCIVMVPCIVLAKSRPIAPDDCKLTEAKLPPCINYAKHGGSYMTPQCCSGLKEINTAANKPGGLFTACSCFKQVINDHDKGPNYINFVYAAELPAKCGIKFPFPIGIRPDCNKL
ncbi:hypothetical protein LXL04_033263 [Taraxacum kok-saghyz]